MSPEEFDNRLKSAFQDEYLTPKEHLWANISSKLEPKAKTPFWYWLLPAIIAVIVGIGWFGIEKSQSKNTTTVAEEQQNASKENKTQKNNDTEIQNSATNEKATEATPKNKEVKSISSLPVSTTSQFQTAQVRINLASANNTQSLVPKNSMFENPRIQAKPFQNSQEKIQTIASLSNNGEIDFVNFFKSAWFPNFRRPYALDQLYNVNLNIESSNKTKNSVPNTPPKNKDFSSKRWFTVGLGPQLAINTIKMNQDSQAWVHKHLWDNKSRLTSNGSGFQAFGHLALKFGKNQRFIFETGLNYSVRTEEIKLNESSYDIAARDNTGRINQYTQILLKVIYGTDTTYYLAASNFSLAVNNKYHILTVPFKIGTEHKITESTFMSYGVGGGFSIINSHNTEHLNMIWGNSVKERNSTQLSASLNANLALYTNFNDIGQIGVYTGLQMYLNPWKVNSNQYAINMRDLQMGITFRKPF